MKLLNDNWEKWEKQVPFGSQLIIIIINLCRSLNEKKEKGREKDGKKQSGRGADMKLIPEVSLFDI